MRFERRIIMYRFSKSFVALATLLAVAMLLIALVAAENSAVQSQTKTQVEGVWKLVEVVPTPKDPAEKPTSITDPQPGLIIFTKGYYSSIAVRARQPRAAVAAAKDPANLTDAEKIARYEQWSTFIANSGTYELKGSMLQMRAIVAKNVDVMTSATPITWEFKLEGSNTLWLIPPSDRATTDARLKFTRLE
jgi:Lipocalin-like domain